MAEPFVDSSRFGGVCYRAAGFEGLGQTRGFAKRNRRYWHHGQLKLVLVRPLTDLLDAVVDPLKRRGVRYSVVSIVAISVCAASGPARS